MRLVEETGDIVVGIRNHVGYKSSRRMRGDKIQQVHRLVGAAGAFER